MGWGGLKLLPGLVAEMMCRADNDRAMSVTVACCVVKMRLCRHCTLLQTAQTTYRLRTTTATDRPVYTMLFLHHGVYCCNSDYKVASVRNLITLDRRVVVRSLFCCRPFALSASLIDCCLLRCFAVVSWFSYREY